MMKKLLLSLILCPLFILAQNKTTDKVVVSFNSTKSNPITLNDQTSTNCYFTVSLQGSRLYTAYQMNILLPEGMTVITKPNSKLKVNRATSNTLYPYDIDYDDDDNEIKKYTHDVQSNLNQGNILTIVCYSTQSENFTKASGDLFNVYVNTTAYMKPGDVDIKIDNVVLTANEITQGDGIYHAVTYKPTVECGGTISGVSGACSINLNVNSTNHWSTCVLPFSCDIPDGVVAYASAGCDGDNLLLTKAESFEAYKPYVLYSENGYSGTVSGTVDPADYPKDGYVTDGLLNGAIAPQQITEGFVMQKLNGEVKFYICDNGVYNIPAGKCWVADPGTEAKSFGFLLEDEADGIRTFDAQLVETVIHDLTGRRVASPTKGIYIENGKKILR